MTNPDAAAKARRRGRRSARCAARPVGSRRVLLSTRRSDPRRCLERRFSDVAAFSAFRRWKGYPPRVTARSSLGRRSSGCLASQSADASDLARPRRRGVIDA
jgi:hypothetical protein